MSGTGPTTVVVAAAVDEGPGSAAWSLVASIVVDKSSWSAVAMDNNYFKVENSSDVGLIGAQDCSEILRRKLCPEIQQERKCLGQEGL